MSKLATKGFKFSPRVLAVSAACVAVALVLSFVVFFKMPQGGSVKLCSMLFIALPGYFFGPAAGFAAGAVFGLLDFILDPYFYHPVQFLLDYILAYSAFGVSGFFKNRKYGLYNGYIIGVALRFISSTLSGVIFFAEYAGDQNVWIYSMGYQLAYLGPEAAITAVLLAVPAFQSGIDRVKKMFA
jgi:thiamine transporter